MADDELFASHKISKKRTWIDIEKEAIEYAQHSLGAKKLFCEVLEGNKVVIKLHERSGFTEIAHAHEGVRRFLLQFPEATMPE